MLDPGVVLRNYVDSTMKSMIDTNTFVTTIENQIAAINLKNGYGKHIKNIIGLDEFNIQRLINLGVDPEDIRVALQATEHIKDITQLDKASLKRLTDLGINPLDFVKKLGEHKINAMVLINKYDICMDDILKMDHTFRYRPENLEFYFEKNET